MTRVKGNETIPLNRWAEVWTLRDGEQTVQTHEYTVLRYARFEHAPEPPSLEKVRAWAVQCVEPHTSVPP